MKTDREPCIDTNISDASQETFLRVRLLEKPKSARLMSKLAHLLVQSANGDDDVPSARLSLQRRTEATELVRRAIEIAPQKQYGYLALAMTSTDHVERQEAMRKAAFVLQQFQTVHWKSVRLSLLIRLLTEPRVMEARTVRGRIGAASEQHPLKRPLSMIEESLYNDDIVSLLQLLWGQTIEEKNAVDTPRRSLLRSLAEEEFRLGKFFRKKLPTASQQDRSKKHFLKCQEAYELLAMIDCEDAGKETVSGNNAEKIEMASFWLHTLGRAGDTDETNLGLKKCPKSYVLNLYSTFATHFDELLVEKLEYQTPTKLRHLLGKVLHHNGTLRSFRSQRALDLGCGTGLSGMAFHDLIACNTGSFTGVDLSPEMISKARERTCYTRLLTGDILSAFHDTSGPKTSDPSLPQTVSQAHDLVIACDVFCYLGDLSEIFFAVCESFRLPLLEGQYAPRYFCFSTEALMRAVDEKDYLLQECARFAHSEAYLRRLAQEHGMEILQMQATKIRQNQGRDVTGYLIVLQLHEKS